MRVLLTALNAKYIYSNLAIRCLAAYGRQEFSEIEVLEFTINDRIPDIAAEIFRREANIVGFSCYIWNLEETLAVAEILKKVSPGTFIIFGGPEVSFDPLKIMSVHPYIDLIVKGEGEQTFLEVLRRLAKQGSLADLPGVVYRENGILRENADRPLLTDLDVIPFPYEGDLAPPQDKIVFYEASRGCPFHCRYCLSAAAEGVRRFSLERVKEDLHRLLDYGVKQINFVDRTFNCLRSFALDLFRFLAGQETATVFHFEIAADLFDEETLFFLKTVPPGRFEFEIGVQSTNQETLRHIDRTMDLDKVARVTRRLAAGQNIFLHLDLIAGLPGENYASFKKSFDDVWEMEPHEVQLGFLKLLKGSSLREAADRYGLVFVDRPPYEVVRTRELPYKDLLRLKIIEDLNEKYLNSHRFDAVVRYLLPRFGYSRARLLEELSFFWEAHGYHRVSSSPSTHYGLLFRFLQEKGWEDEEELLELLKFDFVRFAKNQRLPEPLRHFELPNFHGRCFAFLHSRDNVEKLLPHYLDLPPKEIFKRVRFETFSRDVMALVRGEKPAKAEPQVILFDYRFTRKLFPQADAFVVEI